MFRCWPDGRCGGGNEGSASSGGGVALVPPAAAAEAVEDGRAAAADAATQEPAKKQEADEANGEPSPPDGAALSVHAKPGTLAGVTLGDGGETLVQVRDQA